MWVYIVQFTHETSILGAVSHPLHTIPDRHASHFPRHSHDLATLGKTAYFHPSISVKSIPKINHLKYPRMSQDVSTMVSFELCETHDDNMCTTVRDKNEHAKPELIKDYLIGLHKYVPKGNTASNG